MKIKLRKIKKTSDLSYMFKECDSVVNIKGMTWKPKNISSMFELYKFLERISDISNLGTSNVIDMNSLFDDCFSLTSLPDISNLNTSKVKDMRLMFNTQNFFQP